MLAHLLAIGYHRGMNKTPLQKAVELVGSYRLATAIGVKPPTVFSWLRSKGGQVPAKRVLAVEAATGISRHELRPDIYPPSTEDRAA